MLFPPLNFGVVEESLYRSALPTEVNFPFLQTLGLRTVLCLAAPEEIDRRL
jgi:tyrosine-protein phosphatase OCA1